MSDKEEISDIDSGKVADIKSVAASFVVGERGLESIATLGAFGVLRFDAMLVRIDPKGVLRQRLVAVLNTDPELADAIKTAAFSPPSP